MASKKTRIWHRVDTWLGPRELQVGKGAPSRAARRPDWERLQVVDTIQVVSPGRSGTRWLADVLLATTGCQVTHATRRTLAESGFLYDLGAIGSEEVVGAYLQSRLPLMCSAIVTGRTMVDLDCKNSPLAMPLADRFSAMRFLVMLRDPVGFGVSALERGYYVKRDPFTWGHLCPPQYASPFHADGALSLADQAGLVVWFWNRIARIAQTLAAAKPSRVALLPVERAFVDSGLLVQSLAHIGVHLDSRALAGLVAYSQPRNSNPVSPRRQEYSEILQQLLPEALLGLDEGFVAALELPSVLDSPR